MIEQQTRFSKKLVNRSLTAFDKSQLPIIGGEFDGQKAKARHLKQSFIETLNSLEQSLTIGTQLPIVYEALLAGGDYTKGIGGYDLHNLPQIGVDLANGNAEQSKTVLRLVFGATTQMPYRSLSYLLPPLTLMEDLARKRARVPQLQVVHAFNLSSRLNAISLETAESQAIQFSQMAGEFISEFFPGLESSTAFIKDTSLGKGTALREELLRVAKLTEREAGLEIKEALRNKGSNYSTVRSSIFYGAAHLLMHDTHLPEAMVPITTDQPEIVQPEMIVSVGGIQEALFYQLRHRVKPHLDLRYQTKTMQYFTRHHVPPYFMARDGDLAMEDAIACPARRYSNQVGKAAAYDIEHLERIASFRGDLSGFLARQKEEKGI